MNRDFMQKMMGMGTCQDIIDLSNQSQYENISFGKRLKIRWHNTICKLCRMYASNNDKLSRFFKAGKIQSLDKRFKSKLQDAIDKELSNFN